jgi:hypothetical protein
MALGTYGLPEVIWVWVVEDEVMDMSEMNCKKKRRLGS